MIITRDTREQRKRGYAFSNWKPTVFRDTLVTGDYSLFRHHHEVSVERKTLSDWYSSIGRERERFLEEMRRLSSIRYRAVVVEASLLEAIHPEDHRYTGLKSEQVWGTLLTINVNYRIPIIWAVTRSGGEESTYRFLLRCHTLLTQYKALPLMPAAYRETYPACSTCGKTRIVALAERPDLGIREWVRIAGRYNEMNQREIGVELAICYDCRNKINRGLAVLPRGYEWRS
jgi:hypothetical protein